MRKNPRIFVFFAVFGILASASGAENNDGCNCPPSKFEKGTYYCQHYEDYILAYVLKDFKTGYYIDVGANDPNISNVTRHFYELGWRGINIEPNIDRFKTIVHFRPLRIVIPVAAAKALL